MRHSALTWIVITLILTSCNPVTPAPVTPLSPYPATGLPEPTTIPIQAGDSDAQPDVSGETLGPTANPGTSEPGSKIFPPATSSPSTEQIGVRINGHVASNDGSGLSEVKIYLSLAAYTGERIAITDENGNFQSALKYIPGDENVTVWAELEGYSFVPSNYHWRHYHGLEERTLDFTAE